MWLHCSCTNVIDHWQMQWYVLAETEVLANQLKDEGFCVLALSPGWVNTDMGGDNARKLGMEGAPLTIETSIQAQIKLLRGLTTKNNGEFLGHEGENIDW